MSEEDLELDEDFDEGSDENAGIDDSEIDGL